MEWLRSRFADLTGAPPATFWWLWGGSLVSALATFVLPFLTMYLGTRGLDLRSVGRVGAMYGVGVLLFSPVAGGLVDRFGRRPTLIAALLSSAAATALLAWAAHPVALGGAVLLVGMSSAAYRPAAMALVADVIPPEGRTRAYGMQRWGNNLGLAVSSVLGGTLASIGYGKLFLVDAGTTLVFAAVAAARIPETRPPVVRRAQEAPGVRLLLRDRIFLAFLALQLVFVLPLWQFQVTLPVAMLAQGHGPAVFGRVLAVNGVLIMLLQPWVAARSASQDPWRLLALGMILVGLGYGAYAFCHGALSFGLATGLWSLGEILFMPVASATVAALSPPALRGRYQGAWSLAFGVGMTLAPVLGSACMDRSGAPALWAACLASGALGALGLLALGRGVRLRTRAG